MKFNGGIQQPVCPLAFHCQVDTQIGTQEQIFGKTDDKHRIKEGPLRGHTVGDIAQNRAQFENQLTEEQKTWLDRSLVIEDACVELLEENDIEVKKLSLPEGGQFATRKVYVKKVNGEVIDVAYVGAGTRRPGSKISTEKHRFFNTEADAIAVKLQGVNCI